MQLVFSTPIVPLIAGIIYLVIAGFIEVKTYRVPNVLTLAAAGLALAFALAASMIVPERAGGLVTSIVGMLFAGGLMIPFYAKGWLGAGCVKAQAACGAWIGAGFGLSQCATVVVISTVVAVIFVLFAGLITTQLKQRSNESEEQLQLMHGQLPLSLGTIVGMILAVLI